MLRRARRPSLSLEALTYLLEKGRTWGLNQGFDSRPSTSSGQARIIPPSHEVCWETRPHRGKHEGTNVNLGESFFGCIPCSRSCIWLYCTINFHSGHH